MHGKRPHHPKNRDSDIKAASFVASPRSLSLFSVITVMITVFGLPIGLGNLLGCELELGHSENDSDSDVLEQEPEAFIGSACETNADCQYGDGFCLTQADGFLDGMCSQSCSRLCPDAAGFPTTFCTASDGPNAQPLCHSRCDYVDFPGSGCRSGYACELRGRAGEPETSFGTCVVAQPGRVQDYSTCIEGLIARGLDFEHTTYTPRSPEGSPELTCSLEDPVQLSGPVSGVAFRTRSDDSTAMLMACSLADALSQMSEMLADYDIVEVTHAGTVSCRPIGGSDRLSQHGLGLAIDIRGFWDASGRWYGVEEHWEMGQDDPQTPEGQVLYDIAHRLNDESIFNIVLTPEFNAAHRTVFHVDLTAGADFIQMREVLDGH